MLKWWGRRWQPNMQACGRLMDVRTSRRFREAKQLMLAGFSFTSATDVVDLDGSIYRFLVSWARKRGLMPGRERPKQ